MFFLVLIRDPWEATLYLLQDMIKEACSPDYYYQPYFIQEGGANLRMKLTFWMVEQRDRKAMGPWWNLWTVHLWVSRYVNLYISLWFKSLVLKLWSMDWQHQHYLWACWKWRISGPTLVLLNQSLLFNRILRWFIYTQKLKKCYFKPLWIGFYLLTNESVLIWHPRVFSLRSYNFLQAC